jgi:hypothetical protein
MVKKLPLISRAVGAKLKQTRVATRLANLDGNRGSHLVTVCFAYDGRVVYSAIEPA